MKMEISERPELLSTSDVGEELNLSSDRVRQLVKNGQLRALRTRSGVHIFVAEDVAAFKAKRDPFRFFNT